MGARPGLEIVYIPSWEMQCCGAPIAVGREATFHLARTAKRDLLADRIEAARAATVTAWYSHHMPGVETVKTHGTVRSIGAVYQLFAARAGEERPMYPVSGTGTVEPRANADGHEPRAGERLFVGYLVELETQ